MKDLQRFPIFVSLVSVFLLILQFLPSHDTAFAKQKRNPLTVKKGMPNVEIKCEIKERFNKNDTNNESRFVTTTGDHDIDDDGQNETPAKLPKLWVQKECNYSTELINSVLGSPNMRFTIVCTAPYMTKWTSNITPNITAVFGHANRYDHHPFQTSLREGAGYSVSTGVNYSSQFILELASERSGFLRCESIDNSTVATKIYFFAQNGGLFIKNRPLGEFQPPVIADTRKPFYIPCAGNYPHLQANLSEIQNLTCSGGNGTSVSSISQSLIIGKYNPQEGFLIHGNEDEVQHYRCKGIQESSKGHFTGFQRVVTYSFYNPYINPLSRDINLQFHIGSTEDEYPLGIWCSSENNTRNQIRMIICNSQYECDWLDGCFHISCDGNQIFRRIAIPYRWNDPTFQSDAKLKGTITDPFTRGKVMCISTINRGVVASDYLFLGLDRRRYWLTAQVHEIPKRAIIYMTESDQILYTKKTLKGQLVDKPALFACETSNFVLLSNIKFAAMFSNGTNVLLDKINSTRDPAILVDNDLGFSRKEILVKVTTDMVGVMCLAPWLNSTHWVNISRNFEVRDVKKPKIEPPLATASTSEVTGKTNYVTFFKGDKTRSLFCNATGEPKPSVKWEMLAEHKNKFGSVNLDDPTLHFPVMDTSLHGKYNCIATNEFGSDFLVFDVAVKPPNPRLGTTAIIGIASAFVLLLVGLVVAMKKYLDAKKKRRNLTPEEIKEFLYGNPDILKDLTEGTLVSEEGIQSMAFNPEHEILSSDLSIDRGSIIGEGQFGKVMQGNLRGSAVAVKTTKPNADVSYFLALLSELKIMAYIAREKHPNIVEFLGAVVSEIEKRKVFVVVELSPIGNMQTFLHNLDTDLFMDLLDEELCISLQERTYDRIRHGCSTLNLISWCQQIASGMEFLANKRVIHRDLATRNVLMFDNDVVKITDFGLSRKLYESPQYVKKSGVALPLAGMAIESLQFMQFSSQSDVWAFGVTVWEIFSMGEIPYAGVPQNDLVKNLLNGMRLERPIYAPETIFRMVLSCWELEPTQRPSFCDLQTFFDGYFKTEISNLQIENETDRDSIMTAQTQTSSDEAEPSRGIGGGYHTFGGNSFLIPG